MKAHTKRDLYRNALKYAEDELTYAHTFHERRYAKIVLHALTQCVEHDNEAFLRALTRMRRTPVSIDEFLNERDFLGGATEQPLLEIWPALKDDSAPSTPT